jgi:signal transduction histidine kinase
MWAALGSLVLSCIAGTIMLGVLQWTVHFAIISFAPLSSAETVAGPFSLHTPAAQAPWLMLLAIAGAGLVIGTAFLHRSITVGIIGSLARETELTERVRSTTVQREGAVRAAEVERTRIERDLHDGVQPRLVSVAMTLGLAHQQIDSNPEQAKELVAEAHASTKSAITELRQLTRGIYASVLDDRGLDAALSAVAGRSHIPVQLDVQLQGRYPRVAEAAVYFAIAEALTNAAKHSRAQRCLVTVRVREANGQPHLWARVEDNGVGSARITPGGGLDGINNRVLAAGGTLHLQSPAGGPTTVEVSVPCVY